MTINPFLKRAVFCGIVLNLLTASAFAQTWNLTGNGATTPGTNFLGTTDAKNLVFKVNGTQAALFNTSSSVSFQNSTTGNYFCMAMGSQTSASGWGSSAFGSLTSATGGQSTAMGNASRASGFASFAAGSQVTAGGDQSVALGNVTVANGFSSFAVGSQSTTSADLCTAIGNLNTATAWNAFATGNSTQAKGQSSFTMGEGTVAGSYTEVVLGSFNTLYTPLSVNTYNASDRLFCIGNGTSGAARSNAFTVYKNGSVSIGNTRIPTGYQFAVNGAAIFTKIKIQSYANWPDYVFSDNYTLIPLRALAAYIKINKHLPEVAPADSIKTAGLDIADNQAVLLKKIEELTLYIIDQDKKMSSLAAQLELLQQQLNELKKDRNN